MHSKRQERPTSILYRLNSVLPLFDLCSFIFLVSGTRFECLADNGLLLAMSLRGNIHPTVSIASSFSL